jgi:predicted nucleic acid-binding protein
LKYLLDNNAISEPIRERPDPTFLAWFDSQPSVDLATSALTYGEIRRGVALMPLCGRRSRLGGALVTGLAHFADRIIPVDVAVADVWADVAARLRTSGLTIDTVDQLIAATAINFGLSVVTRNVRDFAPTGCEVLSPWSGSKT